MNSRLDTLQAVVLDIKLRHLDTYSRARQQAADTYSEMLKDEYGITIPKIARYSTHVFHQYTVLTEEGRDTVVSHLQEAGVACGVYYPVPLHLQKAYKHYGYQEGDFPVSEDLAGKVLSLPMHTELTQDIQQYVVDQLKNAFTK